MVYHDGFPRGFCYGELLGKHKHVNHLRDSATTNRFVPISSGGIEVGRDWSKKWNKIWLNHGKNKSQSQIPSLELSNSGVKNGRCLCAGGQTITYPTTKPYHVKRGIQVETGTGVWRVYCLAKTRRNKMYDYLWPDMAVLTVPSGFGTSYPYPWETCTLVSLLVWFV